MISLTRRRFASFFATASLAAVAADRALAQGATVGPAGGIPSSTAPSNSQGTPAGGTGVIGGTRVAPGGTTTPITPSTGGTVGTTTGTTPGGDTGTTGSTGTTHHRRRRRRRHTTAPSTSGDTGNQ